jgi:wobble nucleotide-excising tRNase
MQTQAIARLKVTASDAKIKKLENEKKACQKTIDAVEERVKKLKQRKLPDLKPNDPQIKSLGQARKRIKEIDAEIKKLKAAE